MKLRFLVTWYHKILKWSEHPKSPWYLGLISFIDASLFPLSPLAMLLPMSLANPKRSFHFASIVIVTSFFGGMIGYALGFFAYTWLIKPFITWMGYTHHYQMALQWFQTWGFWSILVGSFMPFIPYKIFTISSGVMKLHFGWFLLASLLGRGLRFLIIAAVIFWGGSRFEPFLRKILFKLADYQTN